MPKLSYVILHYNRPYLLETCIALVRKYGPKDMELIVADDGSDPEIIKAIKKMPIDDIFVQGSNKNTTTVGSCSNTIKAARDMCKGEYFLFSEDDFFLSGAPITSAQYLKNEEVMPRISFGTSAYNIIEKSMDLLKNNPKIKNIQIARDPLKVPVAKGFVVDGLQWHYVDHKIKTGCYYCNWPNLSRLEDHKKYDIPKNVAIWSLEGRMAGGFDSIFGTSNWAVVPDRRYYWHVGTAFSKRLNNFSKVQKRQISSKQIQKVVFGGKDLVDLESFNLFLMNSWKDRKFYLDNDELTEKGLNDAFTSAFDRLKEVTK